MKTIPSLSTSWVTAFKLSIGMGLALMAHRPAHAQGTLTKVDGGYFQTSSSVSEYDWAVLGNYNSFLVRATGNANRSTASTVTGVTITLPGAGYLQSAPPKVKFTGGGGTGAAGIAVVSADGRVTGVTMTNPGSGYSSAPTVEFEQPSPGGIGSSVNFNTDNPINITIKLEGDRTVGRMNIGDLSSGQTITLQSGTIPGSLIFNNAGSGGGALLNKFVGTTDTIAAPIILNDQLNARITTSRIVLSGAITGNGNYITSYGNGVLAITGDNSASDYKLWLWNKGVGNANAQVELGATSGNAAGDIIVGNASRGTSGHAVLQLLQGRTHKDQIRDDATIWFDSFSGSGRNNYFKLMGGDETVGRIVDMGSLAVIENREGETAVNTPAKLTLAGNGNSYLSGHMRDFSGGATAQADIPVATSPPTVASLALEKNGSGTLYMSGTNIMFTGGLTLGGGTTVLRQVTNFRSNVSMSNNANIIFDTGTLTTAQTWDFTKTFSTAPNGRPGIQKNLIVSGAGNVEKMGAGILNLSGNAGNANFSSFENFNIGGSLTVRNGTLSLTGLGSEGAVIGKQLLLTGDSGFVRKAVLRGQIKIGEGINAVGGFNMDGNTITIAGGILSQGDRETSYYQPGIANITGPINLTHMTLRLQSGAFVNKTSVGSVNNARNITVSDSSSIVVGMRVTSTQINVPPDTRVESFNPVTRVVTLSNNVTIGGGIPLQFTMDGGTSAASPDGVIQGSVSSLTIAGRTGLIGASGSSATNSSLTSGGLSLINNQYSNMTNRIPDSTPIILKGGFIELVNDASTKAFSEKLGTLSLVEGQAQISVFQAGSVSSSVGSSLLTFANLNRSYGTSIEFAGRTQSGTHAELGSNIRSQIKFDVAPALDDGIIGGWAWSNNEFVKYTTTNGVTKLEENDYRTASASTDWNSWAANHNVKMRVNQNMGTTNSPGRKAINSLNLQSDTTRTATNITLNLNQGSLLSIDTGGLLSGHGNHTIGGSNLGSVIPLVTVGTAYNTRGELSAIVSHTSNLVAGTVSASSLAIENASIGDFKLSITQTTMGSTTDLMTIPTGTAGVLKVGMLVNHSNLPPGTTILQIINDTTIKLSAKPTSNIGVASSTTFLGGSVGLTKSGPGTLTLSPNAVNTYTGPTIVNNGVLKLRQDSNLGPAPSSFSSKHLQINGGTLMFARNNLPLSAVPVGELADYEYTISDGMRGVYFGAAGGRLTVGDRDPSPKNAPGITTIAPIINLTINNKIEAQGLVELAVYGNSTWSNKLTLGTASSANIYAGGIKTEGSFGGTVIVNGQNTINGLFVEGGTMTLAHANNFSGNIRVFNGTLNLDGANKYNNTTNFSDTITISSGIVNIGHPEALGTSGIKVNMTANGSQLRLLGTDQRLTSIAGTISSSIRNGSIQDKPSKLTIDIDVNETYAGTLNNGGSNLSVLELIKTGTGRLSLTNVESDFKGKVSILGGVLDVSSVGLYNQKSALGTGQAGRADEILIDGGALSFTPTRDSQTTDRSFTIGSGPNAATLVANGTIQAARVIVGRTYSINGGGVVRSKPIGFSGDGARTLTLSGINLGNNEFQLQLSDKSATEPSSLFKAGPGNWVLGTAADFSGQVTLQDGVLAVAANNVLGTKSISTTPDVGADTFTGNIPNGVEVSFIELEGTVLPKGIMANTRYYVVNSSASTFKVSLTKGGNAIDIQGSFNKVGFVPNIKSVASTVGVANLDTFTGNLPNGTAVVFNTQIPLKAAVTNANVVAVLPTGIKSTETYYVMNSNGTTFQVSRTLVNPVKVILGSNSVGPIYYTASLSFDSSEVNLLGGRLELRNVDYMAREKLTFLGGALAVAPNIQARWAGDWDVQANSNVTVGVNSELILDGNILGGRTITQLGEGTIRLRGETIMPTQLNNSSAELDNSRRQYTVQAGTLILDYSVNNNSKLVDVANLNLGGGRRGGTVRLQGGNHEEIVNGVTLSAGANKIFRDNGESVIRLNNIARQEGSSLYFDLARIARVDNLNLNNILGGWAIIRNAVVQASWVLTGTVSRNFSANPADDVLTIPISIPPNPTLSNHYLSNGMPVRLSTNGVLPAPLNSTDTYYVTSAGTRTFKLSRTAFGLPIDITDAGTPGTTQHTVRTENPKRSGPATLTFTAHPDNFPGSSGNNLFRIHIDNQTTSGPITSGVTGSFTSPPIVYTIKTTASVNSAEAIRNFVNTDSKVTGYFVVSVSGADTTIDRKSYGPQMLENGNNDNQSQELGWARNGTNTADGYVQVNGFFEPTNVWNKDGNANIVGDIPLLNADSITYTLRYAANAASTTNLAVGSTPDSVHTIQTGAILVSPTVGANDSLILGPGSLTTENMGNLRNFIIHQYNEQGDLIIGAALVNRRPFQRMGRLTDGNRKILAGITTTANMVQDVTTVTGTGIPANTIVVRIIDDNTVELSNEATGNDGRWEMTFTTDGLAERYFASGQGTNTQNRIMGIKDSSGNISTHDIYLGMPISGPGIPVGATVDVIYSDADIRINANHFFNGIATELTFSPAVGLDKLGGGTLVLSGDNTYSGITTIADGVVRAQKLTDGGVAGSLGTSAGNVAGNLVFNGGVLQYVGENTSTNRFFNLTDFAQINIGHEKTTAIFSGNITSSGTLNAADRLEKAGSGILEMRGDANVNEIKVMEGTLRVQAMDKDPLPQTTATTNVGQNSSASLRVAGGVFEFRGLAEANASLTLGGSFYVDAGSSIIRASSVAGFDPMNRVVPAIPRTTTLNLMAPIDGASIVRSSGGTVRFVENPELGGGNANIFLNVGEGDAGRILGWAVYEDTSTVGVNHFATINANPQSRGVLAASGLYDIGSLYTDANRWASLGEGSSLNVSESTDLYEVYFESGVSVTAGSNVIRISSSNSDLFKELRVGMSVTGNGVPEATFITAINAVGMSLTVSNAASSNSLGGDYSFLAPLSLGGRVGLARPDLPESSSENSAGRDRETNIIRYTSTGDGVISIDQGSTLRLMSGAILLATDVKGGEKSIVGPGNITGLGKAEDGSDLIIHNYNNVSAFTINANIVDNIQYSHAPGLDGLVGIGFVTAGMNSLYLLEIPESLAIIKNLHVGMEVTGTGVPPDTYITSISGTTLFLTKPATLTTPSSPGTIFSFRSKTSFVQAGIGTTILSGSNTYTGNTFVHGGVLRLDSSGAVPGGITSGALANASSRIIVKDGVIGLGVENFSRSLGSATNQIEFKGSGGFAAYGANRTVDFGGAGAGKRLRYGNDGFVPDGSSFILGAVDATHKVTVLNGIDLGSFSQVVRVDNGSADVEGELAGSLSGVGRLIKYGLGTLRLSAQNTHSGGIEIAEGRLIVAPVNNVFGTGTVTLGTSTTNTNKNAVIELSVEGGTHANNVVVGNANTRGADWVNRGTVGGAPGGKGTHSSMLVVNGTPAIAYYDPINQDLKYVRSMDARGTSWFAPVTLDSKGNVGQYPSLTIVNGMPAVSYYDVTNKMLNFVRSTDASGAVWGVPLIADTNPVNAVATLSDGSVIAAGSFVEFDGAVRSRLVSLSSTGIINSAFAPQVDGEIKSIVVDSSDRIVVVGTFKKARSTGAGTDTDRNNIARFSNTGVLDAAFNPNVLNGGGAVSINTIIIQPDGRMLIGGEFATVAGVGRSRFARLEASGALDTSFNVAANGEVFALLRQSDGNILVGGTFTNLGTSVRNRVGRVSSAGVLDAFNPNINASTTAINTTTVVRAIAIGTDNSIYIGGSFTGLTGTGSSTTRTRNRFAKLDLAGNIDVNYGLELNGEVRGLYTLSSGKVVVTGLFTEVGNAKINYMARLNVGGGLDSAFIPEPNGEVRSLIESTGKMILGGVFSNVGGGTQQWVGRINDNGTVDATFIRNADDRGQYSSLALVPESVPSNPAQTTTTAAIAYHDAVAGDLRYVRASNSAATAWENAIIVASEGIVGRGISMKVANIGGSYINKTADLQMASRGAVAISGTPAIAYYDESEKSLKYVLSNTLNGSDWSLPIDIHATEVGPHFSLEIIAGNPAVAYYDSASKELHYRRSNNVAGLSDNLPASGTSLSVAALEFYNTDPVTGVEIWGSPEGYQLLDTSDDVGQYPSLAVVKASGSMTVPAVAYYDATAGNLKYVQANNATGIPTEVIGDPAPWNAPVIAVDSPNDVGQYVTLVLTDGVPAVSYTDATNQTVQFVHFGDSAGYSLLSFAGDTTLGGSLTLDGTSLISVAAGKTLTANGSLTGAAGFKLIGEGSMLINSSNNNFGVDLKPTDQAPAVIRSGSLFLGSSTALNPNLRIDLGDRDGALQTLSVAYATNGESVIVGENARFVAGSDGVTQDPGPGAFHEISSLIAGRQFTAADAGMQILVKDEPVAGRNGIYKIIFNPNQAANTMNLVRASVADTNYELTAGVRVYVLNGAAANHTFVLAESVATLNVSPVNWVTTSTSVAVATTGKSLTTLSGFFDGNHDGQVSNAGGPGAFVQVDTTIDGRLFSRSDEGTLILVKDETNAAWNGVYKIIYSAGLQPNGTMNLVRVKEIELFAGLQVRVLSGSSAGKVFMLANDVAELNISPVYWVPEATNRNVALLANVSGLSIGNSIDLNVLPGTGRMSLGAANALISGSVEFTGPITFKDNQLNLKETQTLELTSQITSGYGVTVSGVISEQTGTGNYGDVLSIVKTGSGVVTLRGNNTFHGGVAVNEGTLLVMNTSGSATGTGAVSVNGGGTLGGIGRIAGAVNLTGTGTQLAKLHVGDPTSNTANETLTINGKITVGANSVVEFSLGVSSVTKLVGTGGMEITETGRLVVSLQGGYRPAVGATFDILDLTGALSFTAGNSNFLLSDYLKLPGIYIWDTSTFLTDGIVKILAETIAVQIVGSPSGVTLNPEQALNLTVTVTGSPDFIYQWQRSIGGGAYVNYGAPVRSSATTNTLTIPSVAETDEGYYQVIVTNGEGVYTQTSASASVIVNDPPTIVTQPLPATINPGATAVFKVVVTGPGPYSYKWYRGTTEITAGGRVTIVSAGDTSTLTITNVTEADDANNYSVVASNPAAGARSNFIALSVNDPASIATHPSNRTVSAGDYTRFDVVASGTAPFTYQWQIKRVGEADFTNIPGATEREVRIEGIALADNNALVRVIVNNIVNIPATSNPATLTVGSGEPTFNGPWSRTMLDRDTVEGIDGKNNTLVIKYRVGGAQTGRKVVWKRNGKVLKDNSSIKMGGVTSVVDINDVTVEADNFALWTTLTITNVSSGLGGDYTVEVKNVTVKKPSKSPPARIAIVGNPFSIVPAADKAKKATLNAVVSAPKSTKKAPFNITYKWMRLTEAGTVDIAPSELRYTGVNTKTLTIANVTTADSAKYVCEVTTDAGGVTIEDEEGNVEVTPRTQIGATQELRVYTGAPQLGLIDFPNAMVGADFYYQIPINPDPARVPVSYRATGLPPGLKLDTKTGIITGRPTVAKVDGTPYLVSITISNAFKPDSKTNPTQPPQLMVYNVPAGSVGVFAGWIPRHDLNDNVGGRFDLITTGKGTFTGKVTLGKTVYPFKGNLVLDPESGNPEGDNAAIPLGIVNIPRKGSPLPKPMKLTFRIDPKTNLLAESNLVSSEDRDDGDGHIIIVPLDVPIYGWRNPWSELANPPNSYLGYHTFALLPPEDSAEVFPQGDSYAYFTVDANGKFNIVGRTADGQTFTGAQFIGPKGEIVIYNLLYKATNRGSLVGQVSLNANDTSRFDDNTISATSGAPTTAPTWMRPADTSAKNLLYSEGFGPLLMGVTGGAYEDPTRELAVPGDPPYKLILDILEPGPDQAELVFSLSGLNHLGESPSIPYVGSTFTSTDSIDVDAENKVYMPIQPGGSGAPLLNPYGTTLSVNAKTGTFTGRVNVVGPPPVTGGKPPTRTATYQGLIVRTSEGLRGVGYFLMQSRLAVGTEKPNTIPQVSNQVLFAPYDEAVTPPEPTE